MSLFRNGSDCASRAVPELHLLTSASHDSGTLSVADAVLSFSVFVFLEMSPLLFLSLAYWIDFRIHSEVGVKVYFIMYGYPVGPLPLITTIIFLIG